MIDPDIVRRARMADRIDWSLRGITVFDFIMAYLFDWTGPGLPMVVLGVIALVLSFTPTPEQMIVRRALTDELHP
jgi:hypothetical protein